MKPVNVSDKRVVAGLSDVNQLAPFKYHWGWKYFLNALSNKWGPFDINMTPDIEDYKFKLTEEEKHVYTTVLAYLTTSDVLAMRNIGLAIMEKITAPEIQLYQGMQVGEECIHVATYQHCIETLNIDQSEIYNRYRVIPEIHKKISIANEKLDAVLRSDMDLSNKDELEEFIMSYTFFAAVFEGTWFYNGFSPIYSMQRRGLMKSTSEQLTYVQRDEAVHASFGIRVVNEIIKENNVQIDPIKFKEMWDECEAAEEGYIRHVLKDPILGYNAEDHMEQFRFLANRRARSLHQKEPFPGAKCALTWLDSQVNIRKEANFFERSVQEYQSGGLNWD